MDTRSALYVAQHKETRLYSSRIMYVLRANEGWMKAANPSVEEVIEQLRLADARHPIWTADMQEAETWSDYYIDFYRQYVPDVEFVPVSLTVGEAGK